MCTIFIHNPSSPFDEKGTKVGVKNCFNRQKIHQIPSSPLTGRTKVGVPQLEIFLSKFYLLNEKEKQKLYIKTPL
jgi:hypothetical protein